MFAPFSPLTAHLFVNEHIFWLEVSVDNVLGVKILKRKDQATNVEPCQGLWHSLQHLDFWGEAPSSPGSLRCATFDDLCLRNEDIHKVPAGHLVEKEIQVVLVLEGGVLAYAKGMCHIASDGLLTENMLGALHNP